MAKIILKDTFNDRILSRHRTVEAALKAQRKHDRAVKRANGQNSYVSYSITSSDGADIQDEIMAAEESIYFRYPNAR